ncbi:MAG: hypothetical protein NTY60_03560 [Proteobacteria bacterium]|nr:hypothetical protein [Pseudomonadota bacterium]
MTDYTPEEQNLRSLAAQIEKISPRPHHSALLEIADRIRPGCKFVFALSRGGWYRPGGVIAANGTRLDDNLDVWARRELADCNGDMEALIERHADSHLLVTRHSGRTHYFVAFYGSSPADFMQLEIEELQEVQDRNLIDAGNPPDDLQELIDPVMPLMLEAQPVAAPRYRFRRLLDIRQTLARLPAPYGQDLPIRRFLGEWSHSSAATRGHFSDHWIIALREHQDRYRNPVLSASLVSRHARELKPFHWNIELSGTDLSAQLQAFDRAAGYASAWYFHLVAGTITPPKIAYAVLHDLDAGFSYLPDSEVALLRSWVAAPYSI